jgi:hypothetical protein
MRKMWISEGAVPGLGVLHGLWYTILTTTFVVCWNLLHWKVELRFPAARYQSDAHQATEWQGLPDHQIGNSYSERNKRIIFRATEFQLWLLLRLLWPSTVWWECLWLVHLQYCHTDFLIYPDLFNANTDHFSHPHTTRITLDLFTTWD